jgi:hypothetical protein
VNNEHLYSATDGFEGVEWFVLRRILYACQSSFREAAKYPPGKTFQEARHERCTDLHQRANCAACRRAQSFGPHPRHAGEHQGERESALITPAPTKKTVSLKEIQSLLKYDSPAVAVGDMRVTDYKG